MVVGQGTDAGAQPDVPSALGRGRNEHFGRGDDLQAGGVVFADPGFVVAQLVQVFDKFQVAFQGQRRVLSRGVERGHEDAETERGLHGSSSSLGVGRRLP